MATTEQKIEEFAEDLGKLLGTAQANVELAALAVPA